MPDTHPDSLEVKEWLKALHGVQNNVVSTVVVVLRKVLAGKAHAQLDILSDAKPSVDLLCEHTTIFLAHAVDPAHCDDLAALFLSLRFCLHVVNEQLSALLLQEDEILPSDDLSGEHTTATTTNLTTLLKTERSLAERLFQTPHNWRDQPTAYLNHVAAIWATHLANPPNIDREAEAIQIMHKAASSCEDTPLSAALTQLSEDRCSGLSSLEGSFRYEVNTPKVELQGKTTPLYFPSSERTALVELCQKLNLERSRLWASQGICEDGTKVARRIPSNVHTARLEPSEAKFSLFSPGSWFEATDASLLGWLNPGGMRCSAGSSRAAYPTSPLMEQLMNDVVVIRDSLRQNVVKGAVDAFLLHADLALLVVDPERVSNGDELKYYRKALYRIEEQMLDSVPQSLPSKVQQDAAPSVTAQTLHAIKQPLNVLHRLLLARFQALQSPPSPTAAKYQEYFSLCEAHLETVQAAERRLVAL